jgi:hypothetical protein
MSPRNSIRDFKTHGNSRAISVPALPTPAGMIGELCLKRASEHRAGKSIMPIQSELFHSAPGTGGVQLFLLQLYFLSAAVFLIRAE